MRRSRPSNTCSCDFGDAKLVGESPKLQEVLRQAAIVGPTNSTVLILGETGTGKGRIASVIHEMSGRRQQAFVKVNCAAIPLGLLESELFGHERGAFTGAISRRAGRFELANRGTLFLDEVGDIPPELQPKLLRVLQEHEFERLGSTQTIRTDGHPESIRPSAMMLGARFIWEPVGWLDESIRTGQVAFERVHSAPFFQYLAEHPEDAAIFNAAMSSVPSYLAEIVGTYDFSKFRRIVDVGGGHGALLAAILESNPQAHGVLQDLPSVVAGASALRPEGIAGRCEIVAGDFFEGVPEGGDAYVLKGIIHDWNDEAAVQILRNCRRAIRPDGTLILLDTVLTGSDDPARALMDLFMMVLTSGRERTEPEFRSLLEQAGFSLTRVISTRFHSIVESQPA